MECIKQTSTYSSKVPRQTALAAQLPPEIIGEIFQCAILPDPTVFLNPQDPGTDLQHFKTLRSVCRQWRATAFSTQSLWTTVWIDFKGCAVEEVQGIIAGVRNYFSYAGPGSLLTLGFKWGNADLEYPTPGTICFPNNGTRTDSVDIFSLWLNFLFDYRTRWMELSLFMTAPLFYRLEQSLRMDMAKNGQKWAVQYLQVSVDQIPLPFATRTHQDATTTFSTAFPQLKTIAPDFQEDNLFTDNETYLLASHPNLSKLEINLHRACDPYLRAMSTGFPRLKKLIFYFRRTGITPALEACPPIDLPELDLLVISFPPSFTLLPRLRTPALSRLQLLNDSLLPSPRNAIRMQGQLAASFHHVIAFIQQWSATLRSFRLDAWFLDDDDLLRQLLQSLSSVESLCIDTWFRESPHSPVPHVSLPNLRRLCIHHHHDQEVPEPVDDEWDEAEMPHPSTAASRHDPAANALADSASESTFLGSDVQPVQDSSPAFSPASPQSAPDMPFLRGPFSWSSLHDFVVASSERLRDLDEDSSGTQEGPTFTFSASGMARREGGNDARRAFRDLEREHGVRVLKEILCSECW